MPRRKPNRHLIFVRGTPEYSAFLNNLLARVRVEFPEVTSVNKMAIVAIGVFAKRGYGLTAPPNSERSGIYTTTPRKPSLHNAQPDEDTP
jgi:hypothetical protein